MIHLCYKQLGHIHAANAIYPETSKHGFHEVQVTITNTETFMLPSSMLGDSTEAEKSFDIADSPLPNDQLRR